MICIDGTLFQYMHIILIFDRVLWHVLSLFCCESSTCEKYQRGKYGNFIQIYSGIFNFTDTTRFLILIGLYKIPSNVCSIKKTCNTNWKIKDNSINFPIVLQFRLRHLWINLLVCVDVTENFLYLSCTSIAIAIMYLKYHNVLCNHSSYNGNSMDTQHQPQSTNKFETPLLLFVAYF